MATIRPIPKSESLQASPGKFRACVTIDGFVNQIGEDTDLHTAWDYCQEYPGDTTVQVYNDKGTECLDSTGKIKKIPH